MFTDTIDLNKIYSQGFVEARLNEQTAKLALKAAKRLPFEQYKMDSIKHGHAESYVLTDHERYPFNLIIEEIKTICWPILQYFSEDKSSLVTEAGIAKAQEGYYVDWHQDSYNQAVLSSLIILPDPEDFSHDDGAVLQFSKLKRDTHNNIVDRDILAEFPAHLGNAAIFDPSSLSYQHRCTKLTSPNKTRYFLYVVMGESER